MAVQQVKTVVGGLVLRVTDTKESDKILTVLTAELGRISVIARGARQKNSRLAAASVVFSTLLSVFSTTLGLYVLRSLGFI